MMEDELRKLPLRAVSSDYADRVIKHIVQAQAANARWSNVFIGIQIAVTGILALLIAWAQGTEMVSVFDTVMENTSAATSTVEQFIGEVANAFNDIRIEPLEDVASLEGMMIGVVAAIAWLLANGWLIVNVRKEKLA